MYTLYMCVNHLLYTEAFLIKYPLFMGYLVVLRHYLPHKFRKYLVMVLIYFAHDFME